METKIAEAYVMELAGPVYGFALKRCACLQDAEDLSQEILLGAFTALKERENIVDVNRYVWTIAHNALTNYYRSGGTVYAEIPIQSRPDLADASKPELEEQLISDETTAKLYREIAYLSSLQRRIVTAYYFEHRKQAEIAEQLKIPVGTVKWHLFEAKRELKKGMKRMSQPNTLSFQPIRFAICGTCGSIGTKGNNRNFLRTALSQNIVYLTYHSSKTVNEIAEALNVSPAFVESEVEYLTEYCFLLREGSRYVSNVLIDEPSQEIVALQDRMYTEAARLFANELMDQLEHNEILRAVGLEQNALLWSAIPYIAALSGESLMEETVSFREAATVRPDGGINICYAVVDAAGVPKPKYADHMDRWNGPFWDDDGELLLWQIDSEWSDQRVDETYPQRVQYDLNLLERLHQGTLSAEEYAHLAQRGYVSPQKLEPDTCFYHPAVLWLSREENRQLLEIGTKIKEKYQKAFAELKTPYEKAVLAETPARLHKARQFHLQNIFYSDGWFVLHCIMELLESGRLKQPREEQRGALMSVICEQ